MMKFIKENIKGFILGMIVMASISVFASTIFNANEINFTPSDSTWNVTNVEEAVNDLNNSCVFKSKLEGEEWDYNYQGNYEIFNAPYTGTYKIELWGAQGGSYNSTTYLGGKGGYTSGEIKLTKNTKLYIYVGGQGGSTISLTNVGGWNGGGASGYNPNGYSMGGGGATDVRLVNGDVLNFDSLKSRIMVAAGGGGTVYSSSYTNAAGYAGGLEGGAGTGNHNSVVTTGATQTSSGTAYGSGYKGSFGYSMQSNSDGWGGGGGSGYYGGNNGYGHGGNGGSSFISGYEGCNAIAESSTSSNIVHTGQANHYSGYVFSNSVMKAGNENMPTYDGNSTMTGNSGNGYAKITLVSID